MPTESPPTRPSSDEIERTKATAFAALQAAQSAYKAALAAHEEFRTKVWLQTPRRRRTPLTITKDDLAAAVTRTRKTRDELLTSPLTLNTLSPGQRELATGLTREGRRLIERSAHVAPSHPAYRTPNPGPPAPQPPAEGAPAE